MLKGFEILARKSLMGSGIFYPGIFHGIDKWKVVQKTYLTMGSALYSVTVVPRANNISILESKKYKF
jgi:hypothetical protein